MTAVSIATVERLEYGSTDTARHNHATAGNPRRTSRCASPQPGCATPTLHQQYC